MYSIHSKYTGDFWKKAAESPKIFEAEMRKGLEKGVMHLQSKIVPKTPISQGFHRASITTTIEGRGIDMYGRVGSPLKTMPVLEEGRKPGKMPPVDILARWFTLKGLIPEAGRTIRQSVYLIGRAMKRRGFAPPHTKGWKMFKDTFEKESKKVTTFLNEARDKIVKRLGG